jgi:outer membrane lipoprotein-sorting protein
MGLLFFVFSVQAVAAEGPSRQILNDWLEKQSQTKSWYADVLQIRQLKSLVRPLETRGRVWLSPPNRFRWELGDPAHTMAIQTGEELVIVYPRLKQMERYPSKDITDPAWKQVMALLEVGFPSDSQSFFARYELVSITQSDKTWQFEVRPAALEARKLLNWIRIEVFSGDFTLAATELVFADGSRMRNQFSEHQLNSEVDEALFEVPMDEEYRVVYPLKQKK